MPRPQPLRVSVAGGSSSATVRTRSRQESFVARPKILFLHLHRTLDVARSKKRLRPFGRRPQRSLCIRRDGDVHSQSKPGGFGNVLDQGHGAPVKLDSVNPETPSRLLYRRGDTIHEHVLTALSRIDELEALVGVWTGKGTEGGRKAQARRRSSSGPGAGHCHTQQFPALFHYEDEVAARVCTGKHTEWCAIAQVSP